MPGAFDDLIPAQAGAFDDLIPAAPKPSPFAAPKAVTDPAKRFEGGNVAVFSDEEAPFQGVKPEIAEAYRAIAADPKSTADDLIGFLTTNGLATPDGMVEGPDGSPIPFRTAIDSFISQRAAAGGKIADGIAYVDGVAPPQPKPTDPAALAEIADIQQSDGLADRLGDIWSRGNAAMGMGLSELGAGLHDLNSIRLPWQSEDDYLVNLGESKLSQLDLRTKADNAAAIFGTPIENEMTWEGVKADPSLGNIGQFVGEQSVQSLPEMILALAAPYAYTMDLTGQLGRQRAQNNGGVHASGSDLAAAFPFAVGSTALERTGINEILGAGGRNALIRTGKAAATEGLTEFGQSGAEYAGGNAFTDQGVDLGQMLDQSLAGAVAGVGMGGAGRAAIETPAAVAKGGRAARDTLQGVRAVREAATLQPEEPLQLDAPIAPVEQPGAPPRTFEPAPVAQPEPATGAFDDLIPGQPASGEGAATVSPPAPDPQPVAAEGSVPAEGGGLGNVAPAPTDDFKPANPIQFKVGQEILGQKDFGTPDANGEYDIDEAKTAAAVERVKAALAEGRTVNYIRDDDGPISIVRVENGKMIKADGSPLATVALVAEPDDFYRIEIEPKAANPDDFHFRPGAKAEPQPAPAPAPKAAPLGAEQPLQEGEKHVRTPAGNKVRTKFEVVDASTLNKAEGALQNRDRSRETTTLQVQDIISKFDPELLGDDPSSDRGAPIVDESGTVLSGNGRMLALNKIFDDYPEQAEAYRAFIKAQGHDIDGIERPVLVRRTTEPLTPEQKRQFVVESNKDTKLEMSSSERARSDADSITPDMLAKYAGGDLNSAANRGFIENFAKTLTAGEMGNFIGSDRRLTQAGLDRVQNAVIAAAYGNPKLLERIMENPVDDIRAISGSLADVAPAWAKMRKSAEAGDIDPKYDITDDLARAAERISHARKQGTKPIDIISQVDAFNQMSPVEEALIKSFYNADMTRAAPRAGAKGVTQFLRDYVDEASSQTSGTDIFGETTSGKAPVDILNELLRQRDNANGDTMFDAMEDAPPAPRAKRSRSSGRVHADAALEAVEAPLEEAEAPSARTAPKGAYKPSFEDVSFTNRASIYNTAAEWLGIDPDKFRLLPAPRQVALLARAMGQMFGIRVDVTGDTQDRFAIDQMLDAFQNVQGMAYALGLPARAMSLRGKLALKLQKKVRFLGAFSPGSNEIILPQRSNSFAHEWGHALDYFLLQLTEGDGKGLSGAVRKGGNKVDSGDLPSNVREAFVDLLNTMFFDKAGAAERIMQLEAKIAATKSEKQKAALTAQLDRLKDGSSQARGIRSDFYEGAKSFDGPGGDYWTSPTEMLARAFEAYVSYKVEAVGLTTEFIGKGDANYLDGAGERFEKTFPKGEERADIFAAFERMFELMAEDQTIAQGEAAARPQGSTDRMSDLDRTPKVKRERNIIKRELQAIRSAIRRSKEEKADRAHSDKGAGEKAADLNASMFMSMAANLRMIQARSGSKSLHKLIDLLAKQDGRGDRTVGRTFAEDVHIRSKRAINRLANILKANKAEDLDAADKRLLRDLLTSSTADVPEGKEHLVTAAAAIRRLLDNEFYENQKAGIDLGYTKNGYLQRVLDMPKVWNDQPGFVRAAKKVYEVVFDNAFVDPETVAASEELLPKFLRLARSLQKQGYPMSFFGDVVAALKALKKADESGDEAAIEAANEKLAAALEDLWSEVRPAFADERANAWLGKINLTAGEEHNAAAPDSKYTKHRSLPPEADKLMEQFYLSDPIESVTNYLSQSARRTAYAERFGADGAKRKALFEKMAAEGVGPEDQRTVERLLDTATGRRRSDLPRAFQDALGVVNAAGVMALLPRATLSSLAEPFTAGLVTGNAMDGFKMVGQMIGAALGSPSGKVRYELARGMGIVSDIASDGIMENRYGQTYGSELRSDRLVSTMFRRTGLTGLTRAQKTAGVGLGHAFLDNLSQKVMGKPGAARDHAIALLRELGVSDPEAFAQEILERGKLPSVEDLDTGFGREYTTAQLRFSDMVIQNPGAIDRPELSQNPFGRVVYGITGFSYAYWKNIVKRNGIMLAELAKKSGPRAAMYVAQLAGAAAVAFLMQATVSTIRERLLNPKRWRELQKKGELEKTMLQLAFTRTFAFGAADTVINTWSGLKYQRDFANVFVGPGLGFFLQAAQNIAPVVPTPALALPPINPPPQSRKTNAGEYNAVQGAYQLASPLLAFGLARLPGGPLVDISTGVGIAYVTSAAARDEVATAVAGPKDKSVDPETGKKVKSGPTAYDEFLNDTFGEVKRKKREN